MSRSSRRSIMERLSASRLSLQLKVVLPGRKLARKIIAACEDEAAKKLYTEWFSASGEEQENKRQELIEVLAKFDIRKEGGVSSALNIFSSLRSILQDVTSNPLIEFFRSCLVVLPNSPSALTDSPENINKKIAEIARIALSPTKKESLDKAIAKMNEAIPSLVSGFTIVCTDKERAFAARAITKQAFYRLLIDESVREFIPKDIYIKSRGVLKSRNTRETIEEINHVIKDSQTNAVPPKGEEKLQNLLRSIGIDLPNETIKKIVTPKENEPEEKKAYTNRKPPQP